ncbi:MAG TPA: APC family permease [Vicinamibacterales bacterium]|nr:APC family permease [Vicinamibacterales bacterium]
MTADVAGTTASAPDAQLVRVIGTRALTASIINVTIASSIFLMPATVGEALGAAAPIAYLVCALLMTLIALCFAAAGSRVSLSGGLYAYIEVAFGGFAGFLGGLLYTLTACLSVASVATAFAGSVGVLAPPLAGGPLRALLLVVLFAVLAVVNVRGIKPGIRLVETITAAKLIPLLFLVGAGVWSMNPEFLRMTWPTMSQVGQASIVLLFAFVGVEVALTPSGEVRDPANTVPRAILLALATATLIYLAVQTVAQGVLGPELPAYKAAPLAETARRLFGDIGKLVLLAGGTVSIFGYVAGDMLGTPRALFALARDGVLPARFADVHQRYHTPALAIVSYAVVVAALAISSSFETLVVMANVSALLLYLMCVGASYELQRRDVRMAGAPFNLSGGPVIQLLAATGIVWLLSQATQEEFKVVGLVLAAASAYYFFNARFVRKPSGVSASTAPDR